MSFYEELDDEKKNACILIAKCSLVWANTYVKGGRIHPPPIKFYYLICKALAQNKIILNINEPFFFKVFGKAVTELLNGSQGQISKEKLNRIKTEISEFEESLLNDVTQWAIDDFENTWFSHYSKQNYPDGTIESSFRCFEIEIERLALRSYLCDEIPDLSNAFNSILTRLFNRSRNIDTSFCYNGKKPIINDVETLNTLCNEEKNIIVDEAENLLRTITTQISEGKVDLSPILEFIADLGVIERLDNED
jgi:hypothetical protein